MALAAAFLRNLPHKVDIQVGTIPRDGSAFIGDGTLHTNVRALVEPMRGGPTLQRDTGSEEVAPKFVITLGGYFNLTPGYFTIKLPVQFDEPGGNSQQPLEAMGVEPFSDNDGAAYEAVTI